MQSWVAEARGQPGLQRSCLKKAGGGECRLTLYQTLLCVHWLVVAPSSMCLNWQDSFPDSPCMHWQAQTQLASLPAMWTSSLWSAPRGWVVCSLSFSCVPTHSSLYFPLAFYFFTTLKCNYCILSVFSLWKHGWPQCCRYSTNLEQTSN